MNLSLQLDSAIVRKLMLQSLEPLAGSPIPKIRSENPIINKIREGFIINLYSKFVSKRVVYGTFKSITLYNRDTIFRSLNR